MTELSPSAKIFTPKQGQYLAYIHLYTRLHRQPPSEADMQQYFRVTLPSVHQMVLTLERSGFIKRQPRAARSIELLVDPAQLPQLFDAGLWMRANPRKASLIAQRTRDALKAAKARRVVLGNAIPSLTAFAEESCDSQGSGCYARFVHHWGGPTLDFEESFDAPRRVISFATFRGSVICRPTHGPVAGSNWRVAGDKAELSGRIRDHKSVGLFLPK